MGQTLDEWLQQNSDRVLARQQAQVDTAKVLVGITLAVATTLVATALQVGPPRRLDVVASCVLATSFIATIAVIVLDRVKEPNRLHAQDRAQRGKWSDEQLLAFLQILALDAEDENHRVVRTVQMATQVQVALSAAACLVAALSLLW